jgi:two-component sensor histidine kinase
LRFRHHLALLALVSTLPLLALAVLLAMSNANAQRQEVERGARDTVRALQLAIDRELLAALSTLEALGTSPTVDAALARPDDARAITPFLDQARAIIQRRPTEIQALVLYDLAGRQIANSQRPAGAPLITLPDLRTPPGPSAVDPRIFFRDVIESRQARFSSLFYAPVARRLVVGFAAPVVRDGRVVAVLGGNILPSALGKILRRQQIPPGWYATLVDDRAVVIARTKDEARYVGKVPPNRVGGGGGFVATRTFEGERVYAAVRPLEVTPWSVAYLAPRAAVDDVMRSALLPLAIGGALLVLTAIGGGIALGRRLGREVASLAEPGDVPAERDRLRVAEVDQARTRLAAAAAADRLRFAERQDTLERQQLLVAELSHRVKNVLSVVQSIAIQTMARSPDMPSFARAFEGRLQALAEAHGQVLKAGWRTVAIGELVATALAPAGAAGERITVGGDPVAIGPKQSVALALVLHELMTNASKYGALAAAGGRLDVQWIARGAADAVTLIWAETGLAATPGPPGTGFGTRLIERLVRTDLGGSHRREVGSTSLTWTFDFIVAPLRHDPEEAPK